MCSLVIAMIEEIRESFKATLANFNTLQAPRGVKVLETVIINFNKRFRDGINVTPVAGLNLLPEKVSDSSNFS